MTACIFRANVGIVIVGQDGRVLEFERIDAPDAWQLPQGGIDNGELPLEAALRELYEETGLREKDVTLIGEYPEWLSYELPAQMRRTETMLGQTQRWFYVSLDSSQAAIDLQIDEHQEFSRYRWTTLESLSERAIVFRRPIYQKLAQYLATIER